jgi:transposase-like protein
VNRVRSHIWEDADLTILHPAERRKVKNCNCRSGPCKKAGHFKNKNGIVQRWVCLKCGKYFSVQQASLDGVRLEKEKVVQIVKLLAEGIGVRSAARVCDSLKDEETPALILTLMPTNGAGEYRRLASTWPGGASKCFTITA